jgi:ABC-2 type transport system permease protein
MNVRKIGLVFQRDFLATVTTKGFIFGLLVMPALFALGAFAVPRMMRSSSPPVRGTVAIVDPTGTVAAAFQSAVAPSAIRARRLANARRTVAQAAPGAEGVVGSDAALQQAIGQVPELTVKIEPADAGADAQRKWLLDRGDTNGRLAAIVVHRSATRRNVPDGEFGTYDLYTSRALTDQTENAIHESLREALVSARLKASNLDQQEVEATMRVRRPQALVISASGEQRMQRDLTRALPFVLGILMFMGIIIGGQGLMTSTVEEKSSRVVEVLLASVSPFDLMAGKLLAQLVVGLITIGVYVGLGFLALFQFAMLGLFDPLLVVYLIVFYILSYLVFGALMMAIGAAVNQMQEAQSMFGPVMLLLMVPYMLSPFIGRAPNSTFSVVMSFLPPFNTFSMMSRLASDVPPPAWQVGLTVLVGLAAALATVWFTAKVFRIGLLMHGKPPNFATLLRWARAA